MKISKQIRIRLNAGAAAIAAMALCGGTALVGASPAPPVPNFPSNPTPAPRAPDKREFSYFLPRTALAVEIKQQLNSCDAKDGTPDITTTVTVTPVREADPDGLVRLDVSSGFLAKRTVKLELNSDGTLASFNSQSEGQGGAVLAAAAKLAIKVATAGVLSPAPAVCTDKTKEAVDEIKSVGKDIQALETLIARGEGGDAQTSLLADLRARRLKLKEQLTAKSTLPTPFAPTAEGPQTTIIATAPANWFVNVVSKTFSLRVFDIPTAPLAAFSGDGTKLGTEAQPNVIYRKGVPKVALLVAIEDDQCLGKSMLDDAIDCVSKTDEGVVTRAVFPQFSGLYAIRAGKGGLFGSRQATVKFDANGVPSALEYGSTGASAEIASLAGVATDGLQSLRDAPLTKLQREIALAEARAKLDTLRAAEDISE